VKAAGTPPTVGQDNSPVQDFSHCHDGILSGLRDFAALPPLQEAALRAREIARQTLALLDKAVHEHHAEEEEELFTAVLRSAKAGVERDRVAALVRQLTQEHREIEGMWRRMRPEVSSAAAGKAAPLRENSVKLLVDVYTMHAQLEEQEFLPLARDILGRDGNHMAALGMSLHMRHAAVPVGHI
jgi:ribosomal protein L12E/L44/L45/RPP1/RPP2